jgi:hypothetical protein
MKRLAMIVATFSVVAALAGCATFRGRESGGQP